jgi:hypothetical protein
VDEFQLDPELLETVKAIRESVRRLFEQLRLKNENGDTSGRDRLERVPALARRNFANLTGPNSDLAIKEAWRLVDFLEGNDQARLSARAREALRPVELDKKLATFRASNRWKEAATHLREALGAARDGVDLTGSFAPAADEIDQRDSAISASGTIDGPQIESLSDLEAAGTEPVSFSGKPRRRITRVLMGTLVLIAVAVLGAKWWFGTSSDPRYECIAIENASENALAAHRHTAPEDAGLRPAKRADARARIFTISDPPNGPVQSIWTTSQFSYAERTDRPGPGGGRSDFRLRVGGWGDTYVSLLQVPVPTNRLVQKAVIQLTVLGDEPSSRPTTMTLRAISENWRIGPGPNDRLWWRDCPRSSAMRNRLPPTGPPDSVYEIDITDLYNFWARGFSIPYGIMLEPEHIGSWGPGRPHYANFSTFYSTRARDPANRPRLVLTY